MANAEHAFQSITLDSELDDCKKCSFCCEDALEHEHLRQRKALGMPWHM